MVGNLATASYYIAKLGITNLRVAAETGYFARLALASRKDWPELNAILQKGVSAIGPDEKQVILTRWIKLGTSKELDSRTILLVVLIVIGVVATAVGGNLFWNYSLRQMVRRQSESLRESEARIRLLLDSTGEAIYGLDLEGNCIFANPACLGMLGYRDTAELLGRDMHDLIHHTRPDGTPYSKLECRIYLAFRQGQRIHVDDEVLWRKDGTSFTAEYWSYPMERDGQVVGSVVTFLDITERKAAEERLRRAQKMEVVGQLTGGIAHDFNNLLTAALANLELLGERVAADQRLRGLAEAAIAAVERGSNLTRRLLTFASDQELRTETVDLNGLVQGMDDLLRRTLGEDIEIVTGLAPELGMCRADPSQAENAILNLAINAREAMPDGGTLKIETGNSEFNQDDVAADPDIMPGQYVVVSITDTGTGMTPEVAERAFDPFFTTREVGKGTGLGLGMVYGFVKQSDGRVEIDSEPGRGTTVRFHLPRTAAEAVVEDVRPAEDEARGGDESSLVVDDDEAVRTGTVLLLESLGYEVVAAEDGPSALARLEESKKFDLLFTDVVMPGGMSGPQLAGKVKGLHPDIKIIFATGFGGRQAVVDEVNSHGAPVLRKPYHLSDLALAVRNALEGHGE
jgi:PAS domain S-box-containing protein